MGTALMRAPTQRQAANAALLPGAIAKLSSDQLLRGIRAFCDYGARRADPWRCFLGEAGPILRTVCWQNWRSRMRRIFPSLNEADLWAITSAYDHMPSRLVVEVTAELVRRADALRAIEELVRDTETVAA